MWLCWILVLITASVGSFALTELPGPIQVEFNSSNFKHVLHWKPGGPENSTYIVEYQMYGYAWQHKPECSRISTLSCDLTDAITEDNLYYARVMAVGTDANSTWSKSEQFNPFTETVIGAPAVKYTASTRSFNVWAEPPTIPPAGGIPRSIQEIFHEVEYNLQVVHSATNQKVFFASNKSGNFTVTPLEPSIEYCGSVNLLLKKGVVLKKSQTVVFCTKTEQEWTLMVILPAAALILLVVLIVGTFIWMAYSYTRHHRSLPRALDLEQILLREQHPLHSIPTIHLISCHEDIFQLEHFVHMEDVGILMCHSCDREENLKLIELGLGTLRGAYAPQDHARKMQTNVPSSSDCEVQSGLSSGPVDNGCSSPYRPQSSEGPSDTDASSQNFLQLLAENYGAVLRVISPKTEANGENVSTTQEEPLNPLEGLREDLLYNKEGKILHTGPGMEMQISKLLDGQPVPFPSFHDDKQHIYQANWQEKQPMEILSSLKEESELNPLLCQYRPQVKRQILLSQLEDKDVIQCEGMDGLPPKNVSLTDILQTDRYFPGPSLLDNFTAPAQVKPPWEGDYKNQLLTSNSSEREGQRLSLQTETVAQPSDLLANWEVRVHLDD
ncbi:uncharacterized protein [Hemitrygon akajei]|uniref:uncharacterized protein isoform X1 n=1 Tax=Hemitrygon akajei TaxID=2704970 RepID=UPI003BF9E1C1